MKENEKLDDLIDEKDDGIELERIDIDEAYGEDEKKLDEEMMWRKSSKVKEEMERTLLDFSFDAEIEDDVEEDPAILYKGSNLYTLEEEYDDELEELVEVYNILYDAKKPDSPTNPDINRIKSLVIATNYYKSAVEGIIQKLKEYKDKLVATQQDPDSYFEADYLRLASKKMLKDKPDASQSYQKMAGAIEACIQGLQDKNSSPQNIQDLFNDVFDFSKEYYEDHRGFLGIKNVVRSTNGGIRLDASADLVKQIPNLMQIYNNCRTGVNVVADKDGVLLGNKTIGTVDKMTTKLISTYVGDDQKVTGKWFKVSSPKNAVWAKKAPSLDDMIKIGKLQDKMKEAVKSHTKTFAANYKYGKPIDEYLTIKPKESILDKARYYVSKNTLDKIYNPLISLSAAEDIAKAYRSGAFKDEVKALSKNPVFIECQKKYNEKGLSEWAKLEDKTDKLIKKYDDKLKKIDVKNISKKVKGLNEASLYDRVSKILTLQILTNPKMRIYVQGIAMDPKGLENMEKSINNYLVRNDLLKPKKNAGIDSSLNKILTDSKLKATILKNYNNEKKAKKAANDNLEKKAVKKQQMAKGKQ